ncbi:histidine kinase [Dysgonomonas alginatilytica]|uniref:Histidine kinase n=1 Tax=Dysgonomonas alginatilytica TaxID=1605892 RepID=A0A2V3PM35_9BACT|nr:histidine kinase [Dysgonomonas alginatilytica]PXV61119.1 histidine kinase [Dysgonomonas alginatilytica]
MKNNLLKNYDRFVILIWIFLTIIFALQYIPPSSVVEGGLLALSMMLCAYPFTTYLSRNLLKKAMRQKRMLLFIGQFFLISALFAVLIPIILYGFSYLEKSGIFPPSELLSVDDYAIYGYLNAFVITLFINFGFCGLRFYEENMKLHEALVESQLQVLHQQINPHFMFNVLNHINILMQEDVNLASSLLVKYAKILRYQLNSEKNRSISIEQEVQFLKDFVDIEKIRWGDELQINCLWKVENNEKEFPSLLLITFIENAFKYVSRGISDSAYVTINFEQKANLICLEVENSKSNIQLEKDSVSGLGLENIKKRLDILYADNYRLTIKNSETTYYTKLVIKL